MPEAENWSRLSVTMPDSLKATLRANAELEDRTLAREIVNTLRAGLAAKAIK